MTDEGHNTLQCLIFAVVIICVVGALTTCYKTMSEVERARIECGDKR